MSLFDPLQAQQYGLQRATFDADAATASAALASTTLIAAGSSNIGYVLRWFKAVASSAGTITLRWGTAAGTIAYRRYLSGSGPAVDEPLYIRDAGSGGKSVVLVTSAMGNAFYEAYYTVERFGGGTDRNRTD